MVGYVMYCVLTINLINLIMSDLYLSSSNFLNRITNHVATAGPTAVHSMAEALIRFLEALPEPVIPVALYQKCIEATNYTAAKQV